mmetsp:Transcript_36220/g.88481  ORF Transcript_36220/g.88481 Transcript_36220/m.88481 type:complete len:215 (-) Transcript_36220:2610-3254(-)
MASPTPATRGSSGTLFATSVIPTPTWASFWSSAPSSLPAPPWSAGSPNPSAFSSSPPPHSSSTRSVTQSSPSATRTLSSSSSSIAPFVPSRAGAAPPKSRAARDTSPLSSISPTSLASSRRPQRQKPSRHPTTTTCKLHCSLSPTISSPKPTRLLKRTPSSIKVTRTRFEPFSSTEQQLQVVTGTTDPCPPMVRKIPSSLWSWARGEGPSFVLR